jgi:hypothetical protein
MKKRGLFISPGGVRSIWLRHDLQTFAKRLNMSLILWLRRSCRFIGQ